MCDKLHECTLYFETFQLLYHHGVPDTSLPLPTTLMQL